MRLTLRTLLAWLDDTLAPGEVKDIGQQVAESPFAQELVERIHKVARRRRLTVPKESGEDGTDPNLVASYLDNMLEPEGVNEYEKICLTSDVHLAEVASVHQILSLIGQKAKVPDEARDRMYKLVRGREAAGAGAGAAKAAAPAAAVAAAGPPRARPRPARAAPAEASSPWPTSDLIRRPWLERFGPALAVVGLIVLLCVGAWKSVGPREDELARNDRPAPARPVEPPPPPVAEPEPAPKPEPEKAPEPTPEKAAKAEEPKEDDAAPDRPLAPGQGVGVVGKADGVLLRFGAADQRWEALPARAPLKPDDRLVGLPPFRAPLQLGTARVELLRESEIRPRVPEAGLAGQFELVRGRVVVRAEEPDRPIGVVFAGKLLKLAAAADTPIGLERADHRQAGDPEPIPILRIYLPEGKATLTAGSAREALAGPASLQFRPPGTFQEKGREPAPAWVTGAAPSPAEKRAGAEFAALFGTNEPPKAVLAQAILKDQEKEVRQLALTALGLIGEAALVVEALSTRDDPTIRRAATAVLRSALTQTPEAAREAHESLQEFFRDPKQATLVEKLLVGYTAKEARDEKTFETLVKELQSPDVGIRELAIDNLRSLTDRDRMGYNPDQPEGPGLKAWQDLLKQKNLRAAPR